MIIQMLHTLLKPNLPAMHLRRFKALMAAVESGLTGASVSITALGRAISGVAHIKHKIKRMDRLMGNPHLSEERYAIYKVVTQWLLRSLPMPLILFDWSPLTDNQSWQLLRASLPVGGWSLTLYEECQTGQPQGATAIPRTFTSDATAVCETHCRC